MEQATVFLVLNATPIIYLCKAGLAEKLRELKPSFRLLTTKKVYEEVYVKGVREASALKGLFDGGIVEVGSPKEGSKRVDGLSRSSGIHPGEVSVISFALELGATAILDDRRARQVARVLGVRLSGTPGIVMTSSGERRYQRRKHGVLSRRWSRKGGTAARRFSRA